MNYYKSISIEEYLEPSNYQDFNINEVKLLIELFPSIDVRVSRFSPSSAPHSIMKIITNSSSFSYHGIGEIKVSKMEDEWYYVKFVMEDPPIYSNRYYKCDQLDGLIKLIKTYYD